MKRQDKKTFVLGLVTFLWAASLFAQGPDTLWTRTYGGVDLDWGSSVQQTSDGGYIIVGTWGFWESPYGDVYLIKTDSIGNTIWTKTYGGTGSDHGKSVQQTSYGGYIIAGYTYSFGAGNYDVYLIKTDVNGDTLWTRTYGGASDDEGKSVQQTSDGGYIVVGKTYVFYCDVYFIKTDENGDTVWTKTFGEAGNECGEAVQQTSDGGYIIAEGVHLIKTDASGNTIWKKAYEDLYAHSVKQTSDNGYIITGRTSRPGAGDYDVYVIKTKPEMHIE